MKKIFVVLLACALLMGLCAIPAAADGPTVTMTADKASTSGKENVTYTISAAGLPADTVAAIGFQINNWGDYAISSSTPQQGASGAIGKRNGSGTMAFTSAGSFYADGDILVFVLQSKAAVADTHGISVTVSIKGTDGTTELYSLTAGFEVAAAPEIAGATVIFNEDFESRYVVKAEDVGGKTVTFTINGAAATAEAVTIGGVDYIGATTPAVKPGAINTAFEVKMFLDGELADTWNTSIEERLKTAAAGTDATLANAAKATLAFCQKAAEEVNKVAGTDYTTGVGTVANYTYDAIATHGSGTGDVMIKGTSVYLKEGVYLNFYVDPQSYADTTNLKLKIGTTTYNLDKTNGKYLVFSVPVELADMTTVFAATVVDGDTTVSNTYSNSVVAYAADLVADGTNAELGQAIMNYVYYAQLATQGVG